MSNTTGFANPSPPPAAAEALIEAEVEAEAMTTTSPTAAASITIDLEAEEKQESSSSPALRWACGDRVPTQTATTSSLPLCIRVTASGPDAVAKRASRSLCLAATPHNGFLPQSQSQPTDSSSSNSDPIWCYHRFAQITDACSQYLWWSPCQTCGTSWRIFDFVDDDQSYYKFPTPQFDDNANNERWEDIIGRNQVEFLPATKSTTMSSTDWLGWNQNRKEWANVTMTIEPCEDPMNECMVPGGDALDTTGDFSDSMDRTSFFEFCSSQSTNSSDGGINNTMFIWIGLGIFGVISVVYCSINKCTFQGREGGSSGGSTYHHSGGTYGGGGGGDGGC